MLLSTSKNAFNKGRLCHYDTLFQLEVTEWEGNDNHNLTMETIHIKQKRNHQLQLRSVQTGKIGFSKHNQSGFNLVLVTSV